MDPNSPKPKPAARRAPAHNTQASEPGQKPSARGGAGGATVTLTRAQLGIVVAATALLTGLLIWAVTSIVSCATRPPVVEAPQPWVSPYDWENVTALENGFLSYTKDGRPASEVGVDVSEHDGVIDWAAVRDSGADFALVRAGYRGYGSGAIMHDTYFEANMRGAAEAGLKVGVYFFSQAVTPEEAREEARFVIDEIKRVGVEPTYPIVFDQEAITEDSARTDSLTDEQLTANALAFCKEIEAAGYQPMIYGNQHDLARLDLSGELADYDIWYAEYGVDQPTGEVDFTIWQHTASGTVGGIPTTEGQVDMNIRFLE